MVFSLDRQAYHTIAVVALTLIIALLTYISISNINRKLTIIQKLLGLVSSASASQQHGGKQTKSPETANRAGIDDDSDDDDFDSDDDDFDSDSDGDGDDYFDDDDDDDEKDFEGGSLGDGSDDELDIEIDLEATNTLIDESMNNVSKNNAESKVKTEKKVRINPAVSMQLETTDPILDQVTKKTEKTEKKKRGRKPAVSKNFSLDLDPSPVTQPPLEKKSYDGCTALVEESGKTVLCSKPLDSEDPEEKYCPGHRKKV